MEHEGLIRKGVGGFYTVEADGRLFTCTARGKFRKEGVSPCAGDRVRISEDGGDGAVEEILPRRNHLTRPPLANLDRLFVVSSVREPFPDPVMLDKTIAAAELHGIQPVVVFTKTDLEEGDPPLKQAYDLAGIPCLVVASPQGKGVEAVRALLAGQVSAFTGNSGVGKSTLLNALFPELDLRTGAISQKLGRGRHTTREVELYKIEEDTYVADTPGFSTFDLTRYRLTDREQLARGFREFLPYLGECQFTSCSHTREKGCAILKAVREGKIAASRHESYQVMVDEVKDWRQWQQKSKSV